MAQSGGRFDFDDGGVYCGAWEDGKAHGQGVCTGPKGQGEYAGSWNHGFEVLGVYTWPSGNTYEGNWSNGKRHNLGVETKARWQYKGEWTHGYRGRYGIRCSTKSKAKYEGTWSNGLQDGYGTETYTDGGTYQGQWGDGMRQGLGIRESALYQLASVVGGSFRVSMTSLRSEQSHATLSSNDPGTFESRTGLRAGFVLSRHPVAPPRPPPALKRNRLFRSGSMSIRKSILGGLKTRSKSSSSIASATSAKSFKSVTTTDSLASATSDFTSLYERSDVPSRLETIEDEIDHNATETYHGEWKNDTRTGYGVCKRSDGFEYEGEWLENYRHGYGSTTFPDGTKEEGKYKYNVIASGVRKNNFPLKSGKIRTKIMHAMERARRAKESAIQKSDIASSRTSHSIAKADQADLVAQNARDEAKIARCVARDQDPSFHQPGLEYLRRRGEDPFKEMDAGQSYFMECERTEMKGPESYHQYSASNKDHGHQDLEAENNDGSTSAKHAPTPKPTNGRKGEDFNAIHSHHHSNPKIPTVQVKEPSVDYQSSPASKKMQYLSPSSAASSSHELPHQKTIDASSDFANDVSAAKKQTSSASKTTFANSETKSEVSSTCSNEKTTPRHKKSFLQTLRKRTRKLSSTKDSGLGESTSSSISKEKPNCIQDPKDTLWTSESAEQKRNMYRKAYTMPERPKHDYSASNKSFDLGSFDYENNQDKYLANYETEMRENDLGNQTILQETLTPDVNSYEYITSTEPSPSSRISPYLSAEHVTQPESTIKYANAQNHSSIESYLQPPENSPLRQRRISKPAAEMRAHNPLSNMTPLQLRNAEKSVQPVSIQPTPAFANYSVPVSSEEFNSSGYKAKVNILTRETNSPDTQTLSEDLAHVDDFSIPLPQKDNSSHSPLPGKLRRDTQAEESGSADDNLDGKSDNDATKFYLIVLVFLLNVGFLAVFLQFLT